MKNLIITMLLIATGVTAQKTFDYSSKLDVVEGIQTIDGATLDKSSRYAILESESMVFTPKTALNLSNCLVKVNGEVNTDAICRLMLIKSYILCKSYKGSPAPNIRVVKNINHCKLGDSKEFRNLKTDNKIDVYNKIGKLVASGNKHELSKKVLETGLYDFRSKGAFFEQNVLIAN